ncbi:tRNA glutamyl-Q(34) synthetase GluQRS [Rubripirellula sp.]|nr:tRNA glutamyl-Q(34) synthetase GluQRS [Rubripirellula sp.]MDB4749487.1 tRNA glutamyl-Q(34) synthetase GluQRS [Rubripirellula sp.]
MSAGRFAPSPTGAQHLGNARTYLLAYWSARKTNAKLVLRIEDVDSPRVKPWASQQAIDDLRWLGVEWDEGPDVGGPNGPYVQTQRMQLYRNALKTLIETDRVFPCTCTRKDIQSAGSAPHFDHEPAVYPGFCNGWKQGDTLPEEGTYCWRFRAGDQLREFDDLVLGHRQCVPADALGAFPVTQKSGEPSYQLAVVVDDAAMGVTEVVRGNDLIASTFRQIELYSALGLSVPRFAHVPLVCGPDGRRLAKRHGDTRLSLYRERGVSPAKILAWAASSAGLIDEHTSLETVAAVIEHFEWSKLQQQDTCVDTAGFH